MKKVFQFGILTLLFLSLFLIGIPVSNAYSESYYSEAVTTSGESLVRSLSTIINRGATNVGYDGLWSAYKKTDCKPGTNIIWDMYSNEEYVCGGSKQGGNYKKEGDCYNREHSVPQSWFNERSPMKSDLFHVYPTDGYVNNRRSSYVFGETNSPTYSSKNGSKVGKSSFSGYNGTVFEPIDEYKGDFARTYFYMATRYSSQVGNWTAGEAQKVFKGSYPYLTTYAVNLFTKWSHEDPVSEKEISRNDAVYGIQKNRNPYIDHPEYIDIIWENSNVNDPVNQEKVNQVITLINGLPSPITLDAKAKVDSAKQAYDALNASERKLVTNLQKLLNAIEEIKSLEAGGGNDNPNPTPVVTGNVIIGFSSHGQSDKGYCLDQEFSIKDKRFYASHMGVFAGELRIGSKASPKSLDSYGLPSVSGVILEQLFNVEYAKSLSVSITGHYGTLSEWYVLFQESGSTNYSVVSHQTGSWPNTISATLPESKSGHFVVVFCGSSPRAVLSSYEIQTEQASLPNLNSVQIKTSVLAEVRNDELVTANLRFGVRLDKKLLENASAYGIIIMNPEELNGKTIQSLYVGEGYDAFINHLNELNLHSFSHNFIDDKAIVDMNGNVLENGDYYQFALVIDDILTHEKTTLKAVMFACIDGKMIFSQEVSSSFYDTLIEESNLDSELVDFILKQLGDSSI